MMRNLVDWDTLFIIVKYFDAGSHLRCLYTMPTLSCMLRGEMWWGGLLGNPSDLYLIKALFSRF
jgi:hypothetical protein